MVVLIGGLANRWNLPRGWVSSRRVCLNRPTCVIMTCVILISCAFCLCENTQCVKHVAQNQLIFNIALNVHTSFNTVLCSAMNFITRSFVLRLIFNTKQWVMETIMIMQSWNKPIFVNSPNLGVKIWEKKPVNYDKYLSCSKTAKSNI